MSIQVRAIGASDAEWLREVSGPVGGEIVVSRGARHDLTQLPGWVALRRGVRVGFALYRVDGRVCELVAIEAIHRRAGAGTALIAAVEASARAAGCSCLWLVTTNDNLDALRFYQRRGYRIAAVHRDALAASRRIKPSIPDTGAYGIEIRDEIELEKRL